MLSSPIHPDVYIQRKADGKEFGMFLISILEYKSVENDLPVTTYIVILEISECLFVTYDDNKIALRFVF